MRKFVPLFLLCVICGFACGQKTFDEKMQSLYKNTVPLIGANELKSKLGSVVLLDTRAPEEFEVSHIEGARMIDFDNFELEEVKNIPKDTEIIVYCSVGYRSERIGEKLQEAGYREVRNLYGGIFDWKNQQLPIVNTQNNPTDSVHTYNAAWAKWLYRGIKVH